MSNVRIGEGTSRPHPVPVWSALGYSVRDADRLEMLAADLVRKGSAPDIGTARRAIAAATWRPLALELLAEPRAIPYGVGALIGLTIGIVGMLFGLVAGVLVWLAVAALGLLLLAYRKRS